MKIILKSGAVAASAFLLAGTLLIGSGIQVSSQAFAASDCGGASWYALRSRTASGEMMNPSEMTAAHRSLRFGTKVKVTNRHNGRSVVVRINDRGPFIKGRIIDLSKGAAGKLGFVGAGKTSVCIQIVS
ncbi:MAG: septal ring lytic transglycosylase RlpA family protein [Nitratireductor sp.]|nr:septal ring lytic transglycosylase RlpA family protein [Nitratireductor sp.]